LPRAAAAQGSWARSFTPGIAFDHPFKISGWVSGRALSRFRPGSHPSPKVRALSLRMTPRRPIAFAPMTLPGSAGESLDIVVTTTKMRVSPNARVVLRIDGQKVQRFDPPDQRRRAWQGPKLRWTPSHGVIEVELSLEGDDDPDHYIDIRDVAFFATSEPIQPTVDRGR